MRTLILSCNTGEGHNACAKAIQEYYELVGAECQIVDSLAFISEEASKVLSKGHVFVYRNFSQMFDWGYEYAENHPQRFDPESLTYQFLARGAGDLTAYIEECGYDTVISTHPFSALMLTEGIRKHGLCVHTGFVATDYTCAPGVKQSDLEAYFIPSDCLREEFVQQGVRAEKLVASGIPVRQVFYEKMDRKEAKRLAQINPENRHIVMACGSMGCGPLEEMSEELARRLADDEELTVVCGTNQKLETTMQKLHKGSKNVHVRGFEKNMPMLLDSADVYITKPGGLSTSEALAKGVPMVLINTVGGCENHNLQYVLERGAGVTGDSVEELVDACMSLLAREKQQAQERRPMPNAAKIIYETMERMYLKDEEVEDSTAKC